MITTLGLPDLRSIETSDVSLSDSVDRSGAAFSHPAKAHARNDIKARKKPDFLEKKV